MRMRRWYAAVGVIVICLVFTIGASSPDAAAVLTGPSTPKLLAATADVTQPTVVTAPSRRTPAPAFGSYAVIALETTLAAALLCFAFLQCRRAAAATYRHALVRLRGPPALSDRILLAP